MNPTALQQGETGATTIARIMSAQSVIPASPGTAAMRLTVRQPAATIVLHQEVLHGVPTQSARFAKPPSHGIAILKENAPMLVASGVSLKEAKGIAHRSARFVPRKSRGIAIMKPKPTILGSNGVALLLLKPAQSANQTITGIALTKQVALV